MSERNVVGSNNQTLMVDYRFWPPNVPFKCQRWYRKTETAP